MDLTYTLRYIGYQSILMNYYTGIDSPYFLLGLTDPCGVSTKYAIIDPEGCESAWRLPIFAVNEIYEELESGYIYFGEQGTWEVDVYYQSSSTNDDPDNAILVGHVLFQIVDTTEPSLDSTLDTEL